ncbi:MAG: lipopolysaccharide biosynthesis protein [Brotaphodocola sp.]
MSHNKYLRLALDMAIFTLGTVLTKIVQFLLMPIYTTYMTTEAYGMAELTNNLSELLFPVVTLCIYEAVFRFVIGSKFTRAEIISAGIKMLLTSMVAGTLILFVWNRIFHYHYAGYLYFVLYVYSFRMLIAYYVRGKGYTKIFAASGIVNAVFLAFFSYMFLVYLGWNVEGYLLAIGFSYLASMIFLFVGGNVFEDFCWNIETKCVRKELLQYSMPLVVYNIGYWITMMSGRYILLWGKDASTAGCYAAVVKLASVVNMFQQAFYAAFQLNTSREFESADKESYFTNIFKYYSSVMLVSGSVILSFSPILAKFTLKKDFYSARVYLSIVLFIAIIDCMFCFYKTMYTTYRLTKRAVPAMMIGATINLIVGIQVVKQYSIWGICFASLVCHVSQIIYRIVDVNKFVKIKCNWKYLLPNLILLLVQAILLVTDCIAGYVGSFCITCLILAVSVLVYKEDISDFRVSR